MKKGAFKNKKLIVSVAVVLAVAIAGAVVIPMLFTNSLKNYMYGNAAVSKEKAVEQYSHSFGETFKFLFDDDDSLFAVSSQDKLNVFSSHSSAAADNSLATVLDIRLRDKSGNSYSMDTSANSVSFKKFTVAENGTSITVSYTLVPTDENEETEVFAVVPVVFTFNNGSFNVSVDVSEIKSAKGLFVEKISILPGLFSVSAGTGDTYYTVPDGCGATIDVSTVTEKPIILNLNMYGEDVSFNSYEEGAVLPFFAVTRNGFSVNAIIDEGDALSRIVCKKAEKGGGYLYNTFTVTPCSTVDGKFTYGQSYSGKVSQTYVVKESGSDYNTIAAQVRDNLTERNYLSTSLNGNFTDLPFFINVIGTADGKNTLTTFENAAEITALLKSRGVRSIALRFSGYGEKGLAALAAEQKKISSELGGEDGFSDLCAEIKAQGNSVYPDTNILIENVGTGNAAVVYEELSKLAGFLPKEFSFAKSSKIDRNISSSYTLAEDYEFAGLCLNDASKLLYTDLKGNKSRQDILSQLSSNVSALGATGGLMLDFPAVYLMKQASCIFSTPSTASCEGEEGVTVVPILQMVLHGSVVYGCMPINVSNLSSEDALLKCVELGCVPSFIFTHSSDTSISYSSYATQTAKLYSKAKQLSSVMDMKMTSHEKVTDGVYKITYDYSKIVYVNYNPSVVEINGVMISAKDFVVI